MRIFGEFATFFGPTEPSAPYIKVSIFSSPVEADDSVRPRNILFLRKSTANSQLSNGPMCNGKRQTHIRNAPSPRTAVSGIGPYRVLRKFAAAHRAEQICQAPTGVYRKREIGIYSGGYHVHLFRS